MKVTMVTCCGCVLLVGVVDDESHLTSQQEQKEKNLQVNKFVYFIR